MTTTDTPEFYAILTEAGQRLQFECLDNPDKTFEMSEMAVGDGNGSYYEPEKTQTKLKNECYRHAITRRMTDEDNLVKSVILDIPEDVTGFTVREVGVFGTDGELLIIGKYPATERKSTDSGAISQLAIKVDLTQINELVLPVLIDPSVNTASVEYVETYFQKLEEKGQANGYASLDAEGLVPKEQLPVTDYVKFSFNSGPVDENGEPALITLSGNTLTQHSPAVCTTADGETYTINEDISLDISQLSAGDYNLFYNPDTEGLEIYNNKIYIQKAEPSDMQINDVWVDVSVMPYKAKIKTSEEVLADCKLVANAVISILSDGGG